MKMAEKVNYEELRTVFDACDPSKSGYITFDDFAGLARQYGDVSDQVIRDAEQFVEDKHQRRLSFNEFSHIVANMFSSNENHSDHRNDDLLNDSSAETSRPAILINYSDTNLISFETDMGDTATAKSNPNLLPSQATVNGNGLHTTNDVRSNGTEVEEKYEDFGDGEMLEFGRNAVARGTWPMHRVATAPESAAQAPPGHRSLAMQSVNVRGSSRRSSRTQSEAPSGSALNMNDEFMDNLDNNFDVLNGKMQQMQRQVEMLTKSQESSESKSTQLKLENQRLTDRANVLEEQLQDARTRSERDLAAERQRYRELQAKYEREVVDLAELTKNRVLIDEYRSRIQLLEASNNDLRNDCARLRADNDRLKSETHKLDMELRDAKSTCEQLSSDHRKCGSKIGKLQKQLEEQKQLVVMLGGELESSRSRQDASFTSSPRSNGSICLNENDISVLSRMGELEEQAKRLANENRSLKEINEELHGSILSGSFDRGRRLIFQNCIQRQQSTCGSRRGTLCMEEEEEERSLAAELEQLDDRSHDGITEQLVKEKEANQKLRIYIDKIILKVLEKYPEILEVK